MGMILYSEDSVSAGRPPDLSRMDATKIWLSHFSNSLILTAIQQSPRDFAERHRATKELGICERKMTFWRRMPTFYQQLASTEADKLRKEWQR
jgi:hypothetical protein